MVLTNVLYNGSHIVRAVCIDYRGTGCEDISSGVSRIWLGGGGGGCGRDGVGVDDIMLLSQVSHFENRCQGAVNLIHHEQIVAERSLKTRRARPSRDHTGQQCTQSGHRVSVARHDHWYSVVCSINTSSSTIPCKRFWTIVSGLARAPSPAFYFSKPRLKLLRPLCTPLNPPQSKISKAKPSLADLISAGT